MTQPRAPDATPVAAGGRVRLERDGPTARITLSNPGKLNAMTRAMWRELRAHAQALQASNARCVLICGEADAFCAGGDIAEYPAFRFDEASLREFHEDDVWGALSALIACDVPMVAAIGGACMGAGMEIASCCDIRIATRGSRFGAPIAKLGFPMAPREAALVARAAGERTAREMLLAAAVFDAAQMQERGFLSEVVDDAQFDAAAARWTERIASLAPQAARMNKATLRALGSGQMPDRPYGYADSAEHREGVAAFIAKRTPRFD